MRLVRKPSGIWMLEVTLDGRRMRLSTGKRDKREAERAIPELMGEVMAETRGGWPFSAALWHTYETVWKSMNFARSAYNGCRALEAEPEFKGQPVEAITYDRLLTFVRRQTAEGLAPATINRKLALISKALGEAVKLGKLVARPPMPRLTEDNVRERYVSPAEERRLLDTAAKDQTARGKYLWGLILFCLNSGARLSEALGFEWEDYAVHGDDAQVTFRDTKNGTHRTVPLPPAGRLAAEALLANPLHGKYTVWYAVKAFAKLCAAAKVEGVTLHILRHTYASRLVQRGVPLKTVSVLLGHGSVAVTERYAHLAPSTLHSAVAVLSQSVGARPTASVPTPCQADPAQPEAVPPAARLA